MSDVTPDQPIKLYLDLMLKCLVNSIYEDEPQDPWTGGVYNPAIRNLGRDWPSRAHTMIGTMRLSNLREVTEAVIRDGVPGDFIETGVWRGGACILMRAVLKAYGVTDRRIWVADSFEGLPEPEPGQYPADAGDPHHEYTPLAITMEQVQANFKKYDLLDEQICFLKGWFKDTLPTAPIQQLAIMRLDGDMYESTMDGFTSLYDKLSVGGFVIVDDYGALASCRQAVADFRAQRGIEDPIHNIDDIGVYWRRSQ